MIIPWQVDVPQDRWPVTNWLIVAACFAVFFLQVKELAEDNAAGIVEALMLDGWGIAGLLGHIWVHADFFHLLGNMWFLWIFGNAICANIGNLRYPFVYVALGVAAGATHLIASPQPAIGASGAINGVVGMFLVMFPQNEITCYFWFMLVYVRQFAISSYWLILFWLFWDILGALKLGSSGVAYFAHLGGFAAGVGMGVLFCKKGWCLLDKYDRSLVQIWQDHRKAKDTRTGDSTTLRSTTASPVWELPSTGSKPEPPPIPMPDSTDRHPTVAVPVKPTCACGEPISVSRQYAGKVVRCPRCGGPVQVPHALHSGRAVRPTDTTPAADPESRPQTIRFPCASCGQKIKVPARHAGRVGKCPRCGDRLRIPSHWEGMH